MSRVIASLVDTGYSAIADNLYEFVQHSDELPDEDEVVQLLKESIDMSDFGHKVNSLFIERARAVLIKALPIDKQAYFSKLIQIEKNFCEEDSSDDSFTVSFTDTVYLDPDSEDLTNLEAVIKSYEFSYLEGKVELATTYTLSVPYEVVAKIKEIDDEGICEAIVDYSCGVSTTHVIETGYLRERAEQNGEGSNAQEYYEGIWKIINDYIPSFIELKAHKPDFLILYVNAYE